MATLISAPAIALLLALRAPGVDGIGAPMPVPRNAESVKITLLSTNLADRGVAEWGFSALVQVDGQCVLFDTGLYPETVLRNAETLDVDLSCVTDVVLSHFHRDHTGGILTLLREFRPPDGFFLLRKSLPCRQLFPGSRNRRTSPQELRMCGYDVVAESPLKKMRSTDLPNDARGGKVKVIQP